MPTFIIKAKYLLQSCLWFRLSGFQDFLPEFLVMKFLPNVLCASNYIIVVETIPIKLISSLKKGGQTDHIVH